MALELHSAPDLLAQAEPEGAASFYEKLHVAHGEAMLWRSYASNMAAKGNSEAWAEEMSRYTSVWALLIIYDQEHSKVPRSPGKGEETKGTNRSPRQQEEATQRRIFENRRLRVKAICLECPDNAPEGQQGPDAPHEIPHRDQIRPNWTCHQSQAWGHRSLTWSLWMPGEKEKP